MADNTKSSPSAQKPGRCPVCGKPRDPRYRPFCSAACRDRDLLNWLDGRYAVPAVETNEDPEGETQNDPEGD